MQPNPNADLIERIKNEIHAVLAPLVARDEPYALLDFPSHSNVGDSAIWLGELAYFKDHHHKRAAFVNHCRSDNLHQLNAILPKGTIFIHGGGNFGDLWPRHQNFREEVLRKFPDRKVVQLPQSIHFNGADAIANSAAVINQHADFTLLVRDQHSYDFATTHYRCEVKLCPDMAFALGPLQRPVPAIHKLLLLLRTDGEKSNLGEADIPAYAVVADWLVDDPNMQKKMLFPMFWDTLKLGGGALNPMSRLETRFRLRAEARLMRGLAQLSSAEYVITDRLHVHILSLLLGIPHTTLDNSYGKLSRFISAWTRDTGNLYQTLKLDDAIKHQEIAMKKA